MTHTPSILKDFQVVDLGLGMSAALVTKFPLHAGANLQHLSEGNYPDSAKLDRDALHEHRLLE